MNLDFNKIQQMERDNKPPHQYRIEMEHVEDAYKYLNEHATKKITIESL